MLFACDTISYKYNIKYYYLINRFCGQFRDAFLHSLTTLTLNLWERNMLRHNVENKVNLINRDTRRKKKKTAAVI